MSSPSARTADLSGPGAAPPFRSALALSPDAPGVYRAELPPAWTVGAGKLHGGLLLAVLTRAALRGLDDRAPADGIGSGADAEPLAVSAEFVRAPETGPVTVRTEVVKTGRTVSVVRAELLQDGRVALSGTVTAGRLADQEPEWADLPDLPAAPPPEVEAAAAANRTAPEAPPLATAATVVLDPETARFQRGERGEPLIRGWARPVDEPPDVLFTLLAGDLLPPLVFNLGRRGWSPTVQLTALVRARPAPGWLRLEASCRTVGGMWFDGDCTVLDSAGRLVCQARQLALAPLRG